MPETGGTVCPECGQIDQQCVFIAARLAPRRPDVENPDLAEQRPRRETLIGRLIAEQTAPVAILRAAQRHFLRLQLARGEMDKGASAAEALKKLQPPVFWKYADAMTAQLRRWSAANIERALSRLYEAEAAVKRTGTPDTALTAQLLIQMAA